MSIRVTPVHSRVDDTTRPWPNRNQDRYSDSGRGACTRLVPAPSPPAVISTAPNPPSSAGRPAADRANGLSREIWPPRPDLGRSVDDVEAVMVRRTGWQPIGPTRTDRPWPLRGWGRRRAGAAPGW